MHIIAMGHVNASGVPGLCLGGWRDVLRYEGVRYDRVQLNHFNGSKERICGSGLIT
jgi:hypothetical protein